MYIHLFLRLGVYKALLQLLKLGTLFYIRIALSPVFSKELT